MRQFTILLVALLTFSFCESPALARKRSVKGKPAVVYPVRMYSLEGCHACEALEQRFVKAGVEITTQSVKRAPFDDFPTVIYSNGASDGGERIYDGKTTTPKTLKIYVEKKKKPGVSETSQTKTASKETSSGLSGQSPARNTTR